MFRELIPLLADRFHLVAPDLPGFGRPDMPARGDGYTFEHIADVIDRAYTEGLSDAWNPVQAHWKDPSEVTREAIRIFLALADDDLAVHPWRPRLRAGQPGRLRARELLPCSQRRR